MKGLKFGGEMYVVLMYDIQMDEKDGAKVSRRIFKTCKRYLVHIQNSVFEGELSKAQMLQLKGELSQYLRKDKDSCILFKARNDIWMEKEYLTNDENKNTQFL